MAALVISSPSRNVIFGDQPVIARNRAEDIFTFSISIRFRCSGHGIVRGSADPKAEAIA
jgi:hypothetical protein